MIEELINAVIIGVGIYAWWLIAYAVWNGDLS